MYTDVSFIKEQVRNINIRLDTYNTTYEWIPARNLPPKVPNSENSEFLAIKLNSGTVVTGYYSFRDNGYVTHHIVDNITQLKFVKEWSII